MKHPPLIETHQVGARSKEWIVRAGDCSPLATHHIAHVGVADAEEPYTMVRTNLPGSYFLASVSGEGRIWLDGRWQRCIAGTACLAPPHVLHGFHAIPGISWRFAWVRYDPAAGNGPLGASSAPVLAQCASDAFHAAVMGLFYEQS